MLASPRLGIVSPDAIAQAGGGPLDPGRFPDSGTGPFELRERSPDRLLLARNTEWWGAERGLGPGRRPARAARGHRPRRSDWRCCATARRGWPALGPAQLEAARRDPLLTTVPGPGADGLGIERSVRGIPPREPAPPLNAVWITGIDAG